MNCQNVWSEIAKLKLLGVDTKALEDAFCEFECGFEEHVKEFHSGKQDGEVWS